MKTIYKYPLNRGTNTIEIPFKSEFLSFGADSMGQLSMWRLVDKKETHVLYEHVFYVAGTGEDLQSEDFYPSNFLGTAKQGSFIWHLFRELI